MAKYPITTGVQVKALRVGIYGVEGVGKTTLAAQFPNPVYIDVEDGSNQLPVARLPRPTSWEMLMDEVSEVAHGNVPCSTLVIDTLDAAETLAIRHVCADKGWDGIENKDYGKGWVYLNETFAKLLDALDLVRSGGRNVVVVAHSTLSRVEQPDVEGTYDKYELKLSKKDSPMVREWCDLLLFMNYRTLVETKTNKKGDVVKAKAKGGHLRVIHTEHHACWDAKNRFGLPAEVPAKYESIAHCIPDMLAGGVDANLEPAQPMQPNPRPQPKAQPEPSPAMREVDQRLERMNAQLKAAGFEERRAEPKAQVEDDPLDSYPDHARALADLMRTNNVTDLELREVVASKGVRPVECPVDAYPPDFVAFLTANFSGEVMPAVVAQRKS